MPHVVLLGDSIFDNAAYVAAGPDVVAQLREILPSAWRATLLAVDGAVVADVRPQLERIPRDATHLVLSVGGNDALGHIDLLHRPASSFAEVLDALAAMAEGFEREYDAVVADILQLGVPLTLCTIYNGALPDPELQRRARTALIVLNDVIVRTAAAHRLPVIELRQVCSEREDYANPIEPSVQGGRKIAAAIRDVVSSDS